LRGNATETARANAQGGKWKKKKSGSGARSERERRVKGVGELKEVAVVEGMQRDGRGTVTKEIAVKQVGRGGTTRINPAVPSGGRSE